MKEATGELSTTVITVVAIAAISTLFIVFLYPQLKASVILNQACSSGAGYSWNSATDAPLDSAPTGKTQDGYKVFCENVVEGQNTFKCTYADTSSVRSKSCNA